MLLSILLFTLFTAQLPNIAKQVVGFLPAIKVQKSYDLLPILAAFLFIIAWSLPNIHTSNETTTFTQHFVGGGTYSACLFVYFKKLFGWELSLIPSLLVLFAWVSAFGVANELIEFTLTKLNLAQFATGDTGWDLLANTLGALMGYLLLRAVKVERIEHKKMTSETFPIDNFAVELLQMAETDQATRTKARGGWKGIRNALWTSFISVARNTTTSRN